MIKDAEKRGKLQAGKRGIIVEGTAGNTGIGLALAGISRGYDVVICLANTQSQEKKNALEQAGAVLVEVPAVPYKNPNNYVHVAERMASEILASGEYGSNVFYANQWDNLSNRQSHIDGTGPEIWEQLGGNIDAFSCATGTGGTLTGVGEYLRSQSPEVKVVLTDPEGGAIVRYFTEGKLRAVGSSISQGIGQGRITGNMRAGNFRPDMCFEVSDMEMLPVLQLLQQEEGICVGGSAGINVAGAIKVAEYLGPGHTIVTVLCDKSERYASQLYNARFLNSVGLPAPTWIVENERKQKRFQKICEESLENVNEPT
jgi:cysteine synthase A